MHESRYLNNETILAFGVSGNVPFHCLISGHLGIVNVCVIPVTKGTSEVVALLGPLAHAVSLKALRRHGPPNRPGNDAMHAVTYVIS